MIANVVLRVILWKCFQKQGHEGQYFLLKKPSFPRPQQVCLQPGFKSHVCPPVINSKASTSPWKHGHGALSSSSDLRRELTVKTHLEINSISVEAVIIRVCNVFSVFSEMLRSVALSLKKSRFYTSNLLYAALFHNFVLLHTVYASCFNMQLLH